MAINLNDALYGAQFRAFQALANDTKLDQDSLVSVDESNRGKGLLNEAGERRKIVVKNDGDEIRSLANPFFSRKKTQRDLNNEVRNLFKETVLKICGAKTLKELPKAVHDVMKSSDYDNDGHPLSVRRIRAVTSAILAEADKEAKASSGGGAPGETALPGGIGGARIQTAPQIDGDDESDSSDDDEASFEYETPRYAAGLPPETEVAFMEFYCAAVKETLEDGRTKEECDNTLGEMFREVGYDKNDRKLLAELLAGGKPRFLDEDGRLPFDLGAVRFAKEFKSILDLTKQYRAKLPKAYGDILADTILQTLKAGGRMFGADDLKPIDAELCEDIAATAKKIDAGKLLSPPPGKSRGAKSLARALDGFQREAAVKYADELLKPNDSDLMTKIKQNLLMNLALAQRGAATESLAEEIEVYGDDLAEKHGMEGLLTAIAPGLKRGKSS